MNIIKKIKIKNFKKFDSFETSFNEKANILIGDNESGKSTILQSIDFVLSGSRQKIDKIGLDNLFNKDCIIEYFEGEKTIARLPELFIELYLNDQKDILLNGKNNSDRSMTDGLALVCQPDILLHSEIREILNHEENNFPFEFYSISFKTFSGEGYSSYRKHLRHLLLDNTQISNEYATREYVKSMYFNKSDDVVRSRHNN